MNDLPEIASKRSIFIIGLLTFLVSKSIMVCLPIILRESPPVADDSYAYILKAEQLKSNFKNMPGLKDMKSQLKQVDGDAGLTFFNHKHNLRIVNHYHPLHSLLMVGLNRLGLTWEQAYNFICVTGLLLICFTCGYWLYIMWGPTAAGIAMFSLACVRFPDHGLHIIIPSVISITFGMLCWAIILSRNKSCQWYALLLIIAMLTMHPIGRIYALFAIVIYTFTYWKSDRRKTITAACTGFFVVLAHILICRQIFPQEHFSESKSLLNIIKNIRPAAEIFLDWANHYGGYLSLAFFVLCGLLTVPLNKRKDVLIIFAVVSVLLLSSIVYYVPNYPGNLFGRMLVPFGVFCAGAAGQSIAYLISWISHWLRNKTDATNQKPHFAPLILQNRFSMLLVMLLLGLLCVNIFIGTIKTARMTIYKINNDQKTFDPLQPQTLISRSNPEDLVLYDADTPMFYYFSYGALQRRVIYYHAIKNTPDEDVWLRGESKIRFIVDWNRITEGRINLTVTKEINIKSSTTKLFNSIFFYVTNRGSDCKLKLNLMQNGSMDSVVQNLVVPADYSGWINFPADRQLYFDSFDLIALKGKIKIEGMRTQKDASLYWPWDEGITIAYTNAYGERHDANFETSNGSFPDLGNKYIVVSDKGSSILLELISE